MHKCLPLLAIALGGALASCVTSASIPYDGGKVRSTAVSYEFTQPPLLQSLAGKSYRVEVTGAPTHGPLAIDAFDRRGLQRLEAPESVGVLASIVIHDPAYNAPGYSDVYGAYAPALSATTRYEIAIQDRAGKQLDARVGERRSTQPIAGAGVFTTVEEATSAALELQSDSATSNTHTAALVERARREAFAAALEALDDFALQLCEGRPLKVSVPVVRDAAGVDCEDAFELLTRADRPLQVRAALNAYANRKRVAKSKGATAQYGVLCGIAACQTMLGDLSNAWTTAREALALEPTGVEAQKIQDAILREETKAGLDVIPAEERVVAQARLDALARNRSNY